MEKSRHLTKDDFVEGTLKDNYVRFGKDVKLCKIKACTADDKWYKDMIGNHILVHHSDKICKLVSMPGLFIVSQDLDVIL